MTFDQWRRWCPQAFHWYHPRHHHESLAHFTSAALREASRAHRRAPEGARRSVDRAPRAIRAREIRRETGARRGLHQPARAGTRQQRAAGRGFMDESVSTSLTRSAVTFETHGPLRLHRADKGARVSRTRPPPISRQGANFTVCGAASHNASRVSFVATIQRSSERACLTIRGPNAKADVPRPR